jgi:hypothetical protein
MVVWMIGLKFNTMVNKQEKFTSEENGILLELLLLLDHQLKFMEFHQLCTQTELLLFM